MNEYLAILLNPVIGGCFFAFLGLIFGSFFNVCIHRLPQEENINGRSRCPQCKKQIPWYLNIPVASFVFLKGRCRFCKKKISIEYPLVEITSAFLFWVLYRHYGVSVQWISYTVFCSSLLVITVIDLHHRIIPNEISLPGILVGFLFALLTGDITWWESLLGALIGGGIFFSIAYLYEKFAKREGLGGGDIKLLAMMGAWMGYQSVLIVIVISSLLGSLIGIILMLKNKQNMQTAIPFGPFLAIGALVYLFWGPLIFTFLFPPMD